MFRIQGKHAEIRRHSRIPKEFGYMDNRAVYKLLREGMTYENEIIKEDSVTQELIDKAIEWEILSRDDRGILFVNPDYFTAEPRDDRLAHVLPDECLVFDGFNFE